MSSYTIDGWEYYAVGTRSLNISTQSVILRNGFLEYENVSSAQVPLINRRQELLANTEAELYALHDTVYPYPYEEIISISPNFATKIYEDRYLDSIWSGFGDNFYTATDDLAGNFSSYTWNGFYHDFFITTYDLPGQPIRHSLAAAINGAMVSRPITLIGAEYHPMQTLPTPSLDQDALNSITNENLFFYRDSVDFPFPSNGVTIAQGEREILVPSNRIKVINDHNGAPIASIEYFPYNLPASIIVTDTWTLHRRLVNYTVTVPDPTLIDPPCYLDLVKGYALDLRKIPQAITLESSRDCQIRLFFYRHNHLEKIDNLTSIDIADRQIRLKKDEPKLVSVTGLVLGTLWIDDDVSIEPDSTGQVFYSLTEMISNPNNVADLFAYWLTLYNAESARLASMPPFNPTGKQLLQTIEYTASVGDLKLLAAHNNYWQNGFNGTDIGTDNNHPLFLVDPAAAFNNHFKPQLGGSYGDLTMDSPRIIEIHDRMEQVAVCLESEKYSTNEIDSGLPRVTTLGYLVENIGRVLGLRYDANGKIDRENERKKYLPATLNNPNLGGDKYSLNCWGTSGLVFPHLPTTYTVKGKGTELFDVVHDIPQMMTAILRQLDVSLSIQHGSEIRVNGLDGKIHSYPNQLAVHLECLQKLESIKYNCERTLSASLVTSNEVRGLYSGIGIPVAQRMLQLKGANGKTFNLPYFTHQKDKPSIATELTTVKINLAVINGVLMPKQQSGKANMLNPFNMFAGGEEKPKKP
jgi:hypothetical protein